ncbi:MAG: glycosyltransferase family 4 protein [Muribaculaceae bacterium]|nr:glycosyltransferase family 4 protein [Muribaculaceae bacterium]
MKITYIIESLDNSGGMERVITQKANWIEKNTDHQITIITFCQEPTKPDFFQLDSNIHRVRWELENKKLRKHLHPQLNQWLSENPQDICISTYGREFDVLPKLNDTSNKIVEFHFCYDINTKWAEKSKHPLIAKLIGFARTRKMVHIANKYDKIVVLTKRDLKKWRSSKVEFIPNPITISPFSSSDCSSKRVIALGRMDRQKGFDYLIECWKIIEKKHPDWHLDIFGSGDSKPYQSLIENNHLKTIRIYPATKDVSKELINSSIYVLSSRYEGFSLTICEAMSCGLPIVTFDCPNGPAELVKDGENGFVIDKVGDIRLMAEKISQLITNETQRKKFGKKSLELSQTYRIENIMNLWENLFNSLISNQRNKTV